MSALAVVTKPADQSTDDLDLVTAVRAGDDRAFELLFVRYQSRIAAYVRRMVRDHGRAEDITQEVFIAALRRMRETDREIAFKPWIYEIAKNACIDAFRRTRNTREVSFDAAEGLGAADRKRLVASGSAPEAMVDAKLAIDNLCGAFGGLSQTHHEILVMRELEGLSYREIGERLGMSRGAVESTLFRARRRLGEEYRELVSGERCVRVRGIVDARAGRLAGLRDQRRVARHISHCQPCRRYARLAGVDLGKSRAPASVAVRIAGLLPLPTFLRRRLEVDEAGQLLGHHGTPLLKWSPSVVNVLDPLTVSGWSRAVATAATVAVAGLGAGATVGGHTNGLGGFVSQPPAIAGLMAERATARVLSSPGRSRPVSSAIPRQGSTTTPGEAPAHAASASSAAGAAAHEPGAPTVRGDRTMPGAAASSSKGLPGPSAIRAVTQRLGVTARSTTVPGIVAPHDDKHADRAVKPGGTAGRVLGGAGGTIGNARSAIPDTVDDVVSSVDSAIKSSGAARAGGAAGASGAGGAAGAAAARGGAAAPPVGIGDSLSTVVGRALDASCTGSG